jgi:hypothetical protein
MHMQQASIPAHAPTARCRRSSAPWTRELEGDREPKWNIKSLKPPVLARRTRVTAASKFDASFCAPWPSKCTIYVQLCAVDVGTMANGGLAIRERGASALSLANEICAPSVLSWPRGTSA